MDIKIELDRSDYVKNRLNLMKSLQIPTLSEAKSNLGPGLAQILFDQCDVALKVDFGLIPLKGAGDDLWTSPSDLLIGKVALKPPLTAKHIQALTHKGILEIGADIEKKFWNETKMHEENYFDARKRHIMDQFEELFRAEARNIELRERSSYQAQHQKMLEEFNEILLEELSNLENKLKREREDSLWNQKEMLTQEWKLKFKDAIDTTTKTLTVQFLDELDEQKNIIINNFKLELQKAYLRKGYDLKMEKAKCKESVKQLRHNLECKNIANMMYVLCMERRKCCDEKMKLEEYYTNEMKKLNEVISDKDKQIKKLTNEKKQQVMDINLRETCLLEIIKQFQKFINFALRAAPTQAEFLLSVEKMMAFELTNTVLKSNYSHLKTCNKVLPWKHQEKPLEVSENIGLEIQDHHNCFEELTPERLEDDLGAEDYLPAFKYKNKLYVREDFRNMVSQGIDITQSNELWSKDVEILIETMRKSVNDIVNKRSEDIKPTQSRLPDVESVITVPKSIATSSVQFVIHDSSHSVEKQPSEKRRRISINEHWSQDHRRISEERRASLKQVFNSLHHIDFEQIGKVEEKPALIAARNSLELISKRGSIGHVEHEDEEVVVESEPVENEEEPNVVLPLPKETENKTIIHKQRSADNHSDATEPKGSKHISKIYSVRDNLVLDTKDSIIIKKASLLKKSAEFSITPNDSIDLKIESNIDVKRKPSKLVTAKNSVELLRESKQRLTISSYPPSLRESTKAKPSSPCCAKIKCNEKCSQTKDIFEFEDIEEFRSARKDSADRSIKLSHIEVIRMSTGSRDTNVAINITPTIYETGSDAYLTELNMYKEQPKTKTTKKKKPTPVKDKALKLPKAIKVLGDRDAKEHLQTTDEFTEQRIHSLIELIKDSPTLLRTFTACTR